MNSRKIYQSLRFPWKFSNNPMDGIKPLPKHLEQDLRHLKPGFEFAIEQTLKAMVAQEFDFLETIMEPNLYREVLEGTNLFKTNGHRLEIVNKNSPLHLSFFDERIHFGAQIDRSKNNCKTHKNMLSLKVPGVPYKHFTIYNGKENTLILKLDIVCNSSQKLAVFDEHNKVVIGKKDKTMQSHKFTFECFSRKQNGYLEYAKYVYSTYKYFAYAIGSPPLEFNNWFITDIDDHFSGNPMVK